MGTLKTGFLYRIGLDFALQILERDTSGSQNVHFRFSKRLLPVSLKDSKMAQIEKFVLSWSVFMCDVPLRAKSVCIYRERQILVKFMSIS
jgi:hypothetical protein